MATIKNIGRIAKWAIAFESCLINLNTMIR